MKGRTWGGLVFLALIQGMAAAGCGDGRSVAANVTAPGPAGSPQSIGGPVNGLVLDTAFRPLTGATVEVLDGPYAHASTTTNAAGQFSLLGVFDSTTRFRASADGYLPATATAIRGTTSPRLDFYLVLPVQSVSMAGDYSLTITADAACADLPSEARTRTYTAFVMPHPWSPATYFDVTLGGAPFLDAFDRRERSSIAVAGEHVALWFGGERQPALVERLSPTTYVAFGATASTSAGATASSLAAPFEGFIDYCVMPAATELPMDGYSYNCAPAKAVAHLRCESSAHRLALLRR